MAQAQVDEQEEIKIDPEWVSVGYQIKNPLVLMVAMGEGEGEYYGVGALLGVDMDYERMFKIFNCVFRYSLFFKTTEETNNGLKLLTVPKNPKLFSEEYKDKYCTWWSEETINDYCQKAVTVINDENNDFDSIIFCISGHGGVYGSLFTTNEEEMDFNDLYEHFKTENCPKLKGKPRIFIMDACRGGKKVINGAARDVYILTRGPGGDEEDGNKQNNNSGDSQGGDDSKGGDEDAKGNEQGGGDDNAAADAAAAPNDVAQGGNDETAIYDNDDWFVLLFGNQEQYGTTDFGKNGGIFNSCVYSSLKKLSSKDKYNADTGISLMSLWNKIGNTMTAKTKQNLQSPGSYASNCNIVFKKKPKD